MCNCGLVGYDARFTRERSRVRSSAAVLFFFFAVYFFSPFAFTASSLDWLGVVSRSQRAVRRVVRSIGLVV